jgi:hypothetical protein
MWKKILVPNRDKPEDTPFQGHPVEVWRPPRTLPSATFHTIADRPAARSLTAAARVKVPAGRPRRRRSVSAAPPRVGQLSAVGGQCAATALCNAMQSSRIFVNRRTAIGPYARRLPRARSRRVSVPLLHGRCVLWRAGDRTGRGSGGESHPRVWGRSAVAGFAACVDRRRGGRRGQTRRVLRRGGAGQSTHACGQCRLATGGECDYDCRH